MEKIIYKAEQIESTTCVDVYVALENLGGKSLLNKDLRSPLEVQYNGYSITLSSKESRNEYGFPMTDIEVTLSGEKKGFGKLERKISKLVGKIVDPLSK